MPEIVEVSVFRFDELDDEAKAKARDWYREGAFDYPWYEFVYDDFERICDLIGIRLKSSAVRLMGGGTRPKPNIYFRGFWSQGDGACFEGQYTYRKGAGRAIREHAPTDRDLHRIVDDLTGVQRRNFYQLTANATHRGHYYHEYCMSIDVERDSPNCMDLSSDAEEVVKEALRDLARWLYRQLERQYDYLNSDACIDEVIEANGYRFREGGSFYG
ncbi:antitoxin of toxin-antitoxin stability system (plasmid) [Asticcacaulis sp. DW145]|uniref:antitoxin of toxin-antitoxin stability system n=1 Tax=Asticcacaulis sp. DW145 TaxID=3095608 RepID=UPI00308A8E95|nr:antitoxin of toxin-antitoxin stability system [Asticcacaulis sp. DW145]